MEGNKPSNTYIKNLSKEQRPKAPLEDMNLVARILADASETKEIFGKEIAEKYKNEMKAICFSNFGSSLNEHDVNDIIQNALTKIFTKLKYFRGDSKLSTWISVVVKNECMLFIRSRGAYKISRVDALEEGGYSKFPDKDSLPLTETKNEFYIAYLLEEGNFLLKEIFNENQKQYKKVFLMFYKEDKSHKEIGEELKIAPSTSRALLSRAVTLIKEYFNNKDNQKFLESI